MKRFEDATRLERIQWANRLTMQSLIGLAKNVKQVWNLLLKGIRQTYRIAWLGQEELLRFQAQAEAEAEARANKAMREAYDRMERSCGG